MKLTEDQETRIIMAFHAVFALSSVVIFYVLGFTWPLCILMFLVGMHPASLFVYWIPTMVSAGHVFAKHYQFTFPPVIYYIAFGYICLYYLQFLVRLIIKHFRK